MLKCCSFYKIKNKKKGGTRDSLEKKREPEGMCGVFYKTEPRGGSEVFTHIGKVVKVHVSETPAA